MQSFGENVTNTKASCELYPVSRFEYTQKREYTKIPKHLRRKLIEIIESRQSTIKEAAKELGINYSTAKNIVRVFRNERRINPIARNVKHPTTSRKSTEEEPELTRFTAKRTRLIIEELPKVDGESLSETNTQIKDIPLFDFKAYSYLIYEEYLLCKSIL